MNKAKHIDNEYSISAAYRYLENAKETLGKSPVNYGLFTDSKYVREGSGIAYLSALKALDVYFISSGMKKSELPQSIEEYLTYMRKKIPLNGKLNAALTIVYQNLHIFAYYRGGLSTQMVKEGFESARKVIEMISKLLAKNGSAKSAVCEPDVVYRKTVTRRKITA